MSCVLLIFIIRTNDNTHFLSLITADTINNGTLLKLQIERNQLTILCKIMLMVEKTWE